MFVSIGPNLCNSVFGILDFRPQEQQQQQCGIASVRIMGGAAVTATNRQRPATVNVGNTNVGMAANNPNIVGNMLPQHVPISYYTHSAPQTSYFNDVLHPMQVKRSHKIHIRNNGKCQQNGCQLEQLSLWIYFQMEIFASIWRLFCFNGRWRHPKSFQSNSMISVLHWFRFHKCKRSSHDFHRQ